MALVKDPPLQRGRAGVPAPCLHRAGTRVWPGSGFPTMTALGCRNSGRGWESPGFSAGRTWPCPALWWGGWELRRHVRPQM